MHAYACSTVQLLQRSRLMQHLSEKCDFHVSPFYQVLQKHKLWHSKASFDCLLYRNISAKKYQNPFMCVKVKASQRWDVF